MKGEPCGGKMGCFQEKLDRYRHAVIAASDADSPEDFLELVKAAERIETELWCYVFTLAYGYR